MQWQADSLWTQRNVRSSGLALRKQLATKAARMSAAPSTKPKRPSTNCAYSCMFPVFPVSDPLGFCNAAAVQQVWRHQRSTKLLLNKLAFARLVREIAQVRAPLALEPQNEWMSGVVTCDRLRGWGR